MLYVDIPSPAELRELVAHRADACVSLYVETTPLTQDIEKSRIAFSNKVREARDQLEAIGFDKRRLAALLEQLDDLGADDEFWRFQANSLAVLATPDRIRTYRLANRLTPHAEVADRFYLKPLLRAVTFANAAYVLALSENAVRLVEVFSDMAPVEVRVPGLPSDAASAVGKSTINDPTHDRRVAGREGQKVRLAQYVRAVDAALRPVLAGQDLPLILAATQPLAAIFRSISSYPRLLPDGIEQSPDRLGEGELAAAARPVLDKANADEIAAFHELYDRRASARRTTTDLSDAARAATFGAVEAMLVDIDSFVPGLVDEETGAITLAEEDDAVTYGVVDEIAGRAMTSGARVLAVRRDDIPGGGGLAAVLRFPV